MNCTATVHEGLACLPNRTALHQAASNGHINIVNQLLGVDGIKVNPCDGTNSTPLHRAVEQDNYKIVEKLLKRGADKDLACNKITADITAHSLGATHIVWTFRMIDEKDIDSLTTNSATIDHYINVNNG